MQQELGIPIHHYVEVDFSGFKSLIDAIGGVELCFLYPTRDTNTGLNITEPGCHQLDGVQALAYARSRYYEEFREDGEWHVDGTADLGRIDAPAAPSSTSPCAPRSAEIEGNPFVAGDVIEQRRDGDPARRRARRARRRGVDARPQSTEGSSRSRSRSEGATIDGNSVLLLADGAAGGARLLRRHRSPRRCRSP